MAKNKDLFLDYGELIFLPTFNDQTLARAHKMALEFARDNGYLIDPSRFSEAHKDTIQAYLAERRFDNSEWSMSRIVSNIADKLGIPRSLVPQLVEIYKLNDHDYRSMEDTTEALPKLAQNRDLHIISNTPHDSLYTELGQYGMIGYFRTFTLSCDVGFRKPRPEIYHVAMKKAGTRPETSLFASHDELEVEGARMVGMQAFLTKSLTEVV